VVICPSIRHQASKENRKERGAARTWSNRWAAAERASQRVIHSSCSPASCTLAQQPHAAVEERRVASRPTVSASLLPCGRKSATGGSAHGRAGQGGSHWIVRWGTKRLLFARSWLDAGCVVRFRPAKSRELARFLSLPDHAFFLRGLNSAG
jgi:hypothetical protein